jgi:hypothetical protein
MRDPVYLFTGHSATTITPDFMSKTGDIFERVERDIDRGDFALARTRLESYLDHKGYDPDVLERLGRIALNMHDPASAGRFWLTSDATGEEVENAIAAFIRRCGENPIEIALRLPRAARLAKLDAYSSLARERLQKHRLAEKVTWAGKQREGITDRGAWTIGVFVITVFAVLGLLIGSAVFVAGLYAIGEWLF